MLKLPVVVERHELVPLRVTKGSAGLDLRVKQDVLLTRDIPQMVGSGVWAAIPLGHVGLVVIRSGAATRGLQLVNSLGVIDSDYRGEIMLPLKYVGPQWQITLEAGTRVAQLLIMPVAAVEVEVVDQLDDTERGVGGFGSTGER